MDQEKVWMSLQLDKALRDAVDALAKREGISRSDIVRRAVRRETSKAGYVILTESKQEKQS